MSSKYIRGLVVIFILLGVLPGKSSYAQTPNPEGPVYIVEAGDTLWSISQRFGVPLDVLQQANGILNPNQIQIGDEIVIPGFEGVQGILDTVQVKPGDTLASLSKQYGVSISVLSRLNRIVKPELLYPGYELIVPIRDGESENGGDFHNEWVVVRHGQSVIELAMNDLSNPWSVILENEKESYTDFINGERILAGANRDVPNLLNTQLTLKHYPFIQGRTSQVDVFTSEAIVDISGKFIDYKLHFFASEDTIGDYIALQGVHAMMQPGIYPLDIWVEYADGTVSGFTQDVVVLEGDYAYDPPLIVNSETTDPTITTAEDEQWFSLFVEATPEKLWQGVFLAPVPAELSDCYPSLFGNRRSYNGSDYVYFHTGLDFCGRVGTEIYAPANGKVVFVGPLTVRGNVTVIDHGWGVYSAYLHQSEIYVSIGDMVSLGQLIGLVGETGRVTGPHLHWEIIVGGVQVEPLDWLRDVYP